MILFNIFLRQYFNKKSKNISTNLIKGLIFFFMKLLKKIILSRYLNKFLIKQSFIKFKKNLIDTLNIII